MRVLLDSVILIDHCNGFEVASTYIRDNADELAVSAITRAEVLAGFGNENFALGVALLDSFRFLPMDAAVADEAARIRNRTNLKLPDAIQAAFASCHGLQLATRNTKDFPVKKFRFVTVPYILPQR